MFKKTTFYTIGVAAFLAFLAASFWGTFFSASRPLRADALVEVDESPEGVVFLSNYDLAARRAAKENKPLLLFFMADDCQYSRRMLDVAFKDGEVERLSKEFVCVEIDMNDDDNDGVCRAFNVVASPTVQFISTYGAPLQRVSGAQSGERLGSQMQAALASVAWRAAQLGETNSVLR